MLLNSDNLKIYTDNMELISGPISFSLQSSEVLCIQGTNGSGKTSLIKTILNLHKKYTGQFQLRPSLNEISYLPQLSGLSFLLPLKLKDIMNFENTQSMLFTLNTENYWNSASGGERQKALLNQCLQKKAQLYILDEPFNHLDQSSKTTLISFIKSKIARNSSFIIVSHEEISTELECKYLNLDELNND